MKNEKWQELQKLQKHRDVHELDGLAREQIEKKIARLRADIRLEAQAQQDESANVAMLNRHALVALMHKYGFTIPAREFQNWRPTKLATGDISGVANQVTVLATDGLLAYFDTGDGTVLCGHKDWFSGAVETLHTLERAEKATKPRKPREKLVDKAIRLLLEKSSCEWKLETKHEPTILTGTYST